MIDTSELHESSLFSFPEHNTEGVPRSTMMLAEFSLTEARGQTIFQSAGISCLFRSMQH